MNYVVYKKSAERRKKLAKQQTEKEDRQAKNLAWHQKRYHRKYDGKFVKRVKRLPAAEETPKAQKKKKKKKKVGASAQDKRETYFD
jgi:hypothetical protein